MGTVLASHPGSLGFDSQQCTVVPMSVVLARGRWSQENEKFKVMLGYVVSIRPAWVT